MFCLNLHIVRSVIVLLTVSGCQDQSSLYGPVANQRMRGDVGARMSQFVSYNPGNSSFRRMQTYASPIDAARTLPAETFAAPAVKRTPGPGCVPLSAYAVNCQTSAEFRMSHGMPTVEQERSYAQRATSEQRRADAALTEDLAKPVSASDSARSCANIQSQQVNTAAVANARRFNAYPAARFGNGMNNACSYDVEFKVNGNGGLRWVTVEAGRWQEFDAFDQWTGQVRRKR